MTILVAGEQPALLVGSNSVQYEPRCLQVERTSNPWKSLGSAQM